MVYFVASIFSKISSEFFGKRFNSMREKILVLSLYTSNAPPLDRLNSGLIPYFFSMSADKLSAFVWKPQDVQYSILILKAAAFGVSVVG